MAALGFLMACWGRTDAVNTAAAPHIAQEFGLGDTAIAARPLAGRPWAPW